MFDKLCSWHTIIYKCPYLGHSESRTKGTGGSPLPSPRAISNCIHKAGSRMKFHDRYSSMIIAFGQFFAHDVALTGMASSKYFEPFMRKPTTGARRLDFFFFFLHFHPFGDPYDMFMQLFYL